MIKVLFVSDIHLLPKTPIHRGETYLFETLKVLDKIIQVVEENKVDVLIFTGDIFDRQFITTKLMYLNAIIEKFLFLSNITQCNVYSVLGNHEQTYYNANPFYLISDIQNSPICKDLLKDKVLPSLISPCIKVVDKLNIGNVDIHLFHYDKLNKNYITELDLNKGNIGVYHDDLISFSSEKELYHHSMDNGISVHNTNIFKGINLAICGHIHKPIPPFRCGDTMVLTPGSVIPRTSAETHTEIFLPIIEIYDKEVKVDTIKFDISFLQDTLDKSSVEASQEKYQTNKIFKMVKQKAKVQSYEDMLRTLSPKIINIINKASSPLNIEDIL